MSTAGRGKPGTSSPRFERGSRTRAHVLTGPTLMPGVLVSSLITLIPRILVGWLLDLTLIPGFSRSHKLPSSPGPVDVFTDLTSSLRSQLTPALEHGRTFQVLCGPRPLAMAQGFPREEGSGEKNGGTHCSP